jgi:hypothetical protein
MRTDRLKFALHPKQTITLPVGCEITGAHLENDISFLDLSLPDSLPIREDIAWTPQGHFGPDGVQVKTYDATIMVFMEGETKTETVDDKEVLVPIPIPEPSDKLRKLAVFETVECVATWHVFQSTEE